MQNNKFIVFGAPDIGEDEITEVVDTLKSGWIGTGPKTAKFEIDFSTFKSTPHAIATNSCTAALHLSLKALGIGPGDEVITTPLTFCATANAIIHAGAKPVLADINPNTLNIDPITIEQKITKKTRCILPVHFAGRPCEMDQINAIANKNNLLIIEDCAHAIEATYHGKSAGTFGNIGCFSFYVTKNITTSEGGMAITSNSVLAEKLKRLALHGMSKDAWKRFSPTGYQHYDVEYAGFKYNMTDIQASIGIHQLKKISKNWERRKNIWETYNCQLNLLPITLPPAPEKNTTHAYHLYTILIDEQRTKISRDAFLNEMTNLGIGTGVHYRSLPEYSFYQKEYSWNPNEYPNAFKVGTQTISLPLSANMTDDDIERVILSVKKILKNAN